MEMINWYWLLERFEKGCFKLVKRNKHGENHVGRMEYECECDLFLMYRKEKCYLGKPRLRF